MKSWKKETPIPSRLRGRGVEVSKTLFYFIGKTACGALLNWKMPARRRARRQDDSWIRRYKNLPLQNRHQVRHHLENNPYPEVLLRSCGECPWKSFLLVDFRCIFAQFLDIWFHGVFLLWEDYITESIKIMQKTIFYELWTLFSRTFLRGRRACG